MRIFLVAFCLLFALTSGVQNNIDSLRTNLAKAKHDSVRLIAYFEIAKAYGYGFPDSALVNCNKALEFADKLPVSVKTAGSVAIHKANIVRYIGNIYLVSFRDYHTASQFYAKSLDIYEMFNEVKGQSAVLMNLGVAYSYQGLYDKSLEMYQKALALNQKIEDKAGIANCYVNLGHAYFDLGQLEKALEHYLNELSYREELGDRRAIANSYLSIGTVHNRMGVNSKAIEYFEQALAICVDLSDIRGQANCYNNIGNSYMALKEYVKAIDLYTQSLNLLEQIGDRYGISAAYTNIGNILLSTKKHDEAVKYYTKALQIKKDLGDKQGMALLYLNIATLNSSLADSETISVTQRNKYLQAALDNGNKAFDIATELGMLQYISNSSFVLFEVHKKLGNYQRSIRYAENYITTKDSLINEEKTKALTEMQTKYETEKKQQEIEKQKLVIEKQEIDNHRQRTQLNFTISGIVLLTLLAFLIFTGYQQKKRSNRIISEKNVMLEQANEEISAQRDQIQEQRDMVISQKEFIELQKNKIDDSIRYAQRIQSAMMPTNQILTIFFKEHFIIFRPKDVVSGDFYWATKVNDILIVSVSDCTGHGVPGAFMSMLGISFLNEIVRKKEVTTPAQVLNTLRESVIEALGQTTGWESQKDGMDISLIAIDVKSGNCQWAGAGNPIWIVRNESLGKEFSDPLDLVEVIKADNMTVAISNRMSSFTNHQFKLNPGDRIYMFSDGLIDQIGGSDERKFMSKRLKQIVATTAKLSLYEQKDAIENALNKWISPVEGASYEQIDDITFLGIQV